MIATIFKALFAGIFFSLLLSGGQADAGPADGRGFFEANKCGSCHLTEPRPATYSIEDQLSEKGPDLWYAGSKFKAAFIEGWLQAPKPIRPMSYNSLEEKNTGAHPALNAAEAGAVAAFLMSLTAKEAIGSEITPKSSGKGRFIFTKKLGCYGCHSLKKGKRVIGGMTGPSFVGLSERLKADWIYAYLSNPEAFRPVAPKPNYSGIISDADMRILAAYLASLN